MKPSTFTGFVIVAWLAICVFGTVGYCWNIARFLDADCSRETKLCVVRGFGIVVPPLGAVVGYMGDGEESK